MDPDFRYTKRFEIDVDPLIGAFFLIPFKYSVLVKFVSCSSSHILLIFVLLHFNFFKEIALHFSRNKRLLHF